MRCERRQAEALRPTAALARLRASAARTASGSGRPGKSVMVMTMLPSVSCASALTAPR